MSNLNRWRKLAGLITERRANQGQGSISRAAELDSSGLTRRLGGVTAQNAVKGTILQNNPDLPREHVHTAPPSSNEPDVWFGVRGDFYAEEDKDSPYKQPGPYQDLWKYVIEVKKGPSATFDAPKADMEALRSEGGDTSQPSHIQKVMEKENIIVISSANVEEMSIIRVTDAKGAHPSGSGPIPDALASRLLGAGNYVNRTSAQVANSLSYEPRADKDGSIKRYEWTITEKGFRDIPPDANDPEQNDSGLQATEITVDENESWSEFVRDYFTNTPSIQENRAALADYIAEKHPGSIFADQDTILEYQTAVDKFGSSFFFGAWVSTAGSDRGGRFYPIIPARTKSYFGKFADAVVDMESEMTEYKAAEAIPSGTTRGALDVAVGKGGSESFAFAVIESSPSDEAAAAIDDFEAEWLGDVKSVSPGGGINTRVLDRYAKAWKKKRGVKQASSLDVFGDIILGIAAGFLDIEDFTTYGARELLARYFGEQGLDVSAIPEMDLEKIAKAIRKHVLHYRSANPSFYALQPAADELAAYNDASNYGKAKLVKKWKQKNPEFTHRGGKDPRKWDHLDLVDTNHPSVVKSLAASKNYDLKSTLFEGEIEAEIEAEVVDADVPALEDVVDLAPETIEFFSVLDAEVQKLKSVIDNNESTTAPTDQVTPKPEEEAKTVADKISNMA